MDITATDADLVARAQGGDMEAYATLIEHNQKLAVGLAALVMGDGTDAEDVAQEAFIKAYYALDRFRPGASFRAWFVRIVANEARNFKAAAQRRAGLRTRLAEHDSVRVLAPSAEADAVANEQRVGLLAALEQLREDDREILAYRYLFDLSEAEMALALGCSRGTVKSRLSRSLGRLRQDLNKAAPLLLLTPDVGGFLAAHLPPAVAEMPGADPETFAAAIAQHIGATGAGAGSASAAGSGGSGGGGGNGGSGVGGTGLSTQQVVASVAGGVAVLGLVAAGMLLSIGQRGGSTGQVTQPSSALVTTQAPVQASAPVQPAPQPPVVSAAPQASPSPAPVIVAYGGELTDAQRQELSPLFSTDGQVDTVTVSHADLVAALQAAGLTVDGSEHAISSAALTCLKAGDGLRVRTANISQLPAAAYANALVSLGIADASVIVAAPPGMPMTGETALVGVLKAYPLCHQGQPPEPERLRLAYDQLGATSDLAAAGGAWDRAAAVMLRASQTAITGGASDAATLGRSLDAAAAAEGLAMTSDVRAEAISVLSRLGAVEHGAWGHGYAIQQAGPYEVQVKPLGS